MWLQAQSLVGLVAIPLIAWAISEKRGAIAPARLVRILVGGVGLQVLIAGLLLNVPAARAAFDWAGSLVASLQAAKGQDVDAIYDQQEAAGGVEGPRVVEDAECVRRQGAHPPDARWIEQDRRSAREHGGVASLA